MFLFFIFRNRCGLGGCSGHSSRKKADVADAFKAPCSYPHGIGLEYSSASVSPPKGVHSASQGLKCQGINSPREQRLPWWMGLGNKYLGQIYGPTSLFKLCPWAVLLTLVAFLTIVFSCNFSSVKYKLGLLR